MRYFPHFIGKDTKSQGNLVSQSVNAIETCKFDPSLPLAFKLAQLFGLSIEQIFSNEP